MTLPKNPACANADHCHQPFQSLHVESCGATVSAHQNTVDDSCKQAGGNKHKDRPPPEAQGNAPHGRHEEWKHQGSEPSREAGRAQTPHRLMKREKMGKANDRQYEAEARCIHGCSDSPFSGDERRYRKHMAAASSTGAAQFKSTGMKIPSVALESWYRR